MNKVRLGIVGVGGMGTAHAREVLDKKVNRCELTAVCDVDPKQLAKYGDHLQKFEDSRELIRSGAVDAILIATPHYGHTTVGVDALQNGVHVLTEKPISVHKADCERLIAAANKNKKLVFAAMFNQRTDPHYQKLRNLVKSGELGEITRVTWLITDWFRTEYYYASGTWRATWKGEGGGVLLNQCPHNLDLLQWIAGMPCKVRGFCSLGKRHHIEVEDEVTAYFEYPNGATGTFVTTTGEAPGTNRFEIAGDKGKVTLEGGRIHFVRNEMSMFKFSRTVKASFASPSVWNIDIPAHGSGGQHLEVKQNFVNAILDGETLVAPGREGIHSVELANAMLYSSLLGKTVDLPMDSKAYEKTLKKLIRDSKFVKKAGHGQSDDLSKSWH